MMNMEFIKAEKEDVHFLFEVRNERESVKFSKRGILTLNEIEEDYLHNSKKQAFIAKVQGKSVGYLIFETLNTDELEISVAITKHFRGQGLGKILIEKGTQFGINELGAKRIVATVFPENTTSLKIFQGNSYQITDTGVLPWKLAYDASEVRKSERKIVFIFDFDGVIVNSTGLLYQVYLDFLNEFGKDGNPSEFNRLNGPKLEEIIDYLAEKHQLSETKSTLFTKYHQSFESVYKSLRADKEVVEVLKAIRYRNFKIALASSAQREIIIDFLKQNRLKSYFDFIITGNDVTNAKPSPEIYLKVKQYFPGYEYYVVEDSENGLKSAIQAGMKTIHLNHFTKSSKLTVSYEIKNLRELKHVFTEIDLKCYTLAKSKKIILRVVPFTNEFGEEKNRMIDHIWDTHRQTKKLTNENIVCYKSHVKTENKLVVECYIGQYKHFYASYIQPDLKLNILPIGVSGIILDDQNCSVLAVRRNVTQYEGFYEFIPTGGADAGKNKNNYILFEDQLVEEFLEETLIDKSCLKKIEPYCLIFDESHAVYDIGCKIFIKGKLRHLFRDKHIDEYHNMQISAIESIRKKINKFNCVPVSIVLLNNLEIKPFIKQLKINKMVSDELSLEENIA